METGGAGGAGPSSPDIDQKHHNYLPSNIGPWATTIKNLNILFCPIATGFARCSGGEVFIEL